MNTFSLILEGGSAVARTSCCLQVWNSTHRVMSEVVDMRGQTILHFTDTLSPVQVILRDCTRIKEYGNVQAFEPFPSMFTVAIPDLLERQTHHHIINYSLYYSHDIDTPHQITLKHVMLIVCLALLLIYNVMVRVRKPPEHLPSPEAASASVEPSGSRGYSYQPPLRLAHKMSEEDRRLLHQAFSGAELCASPEEGATTSPEDSTAAPPPVPEMPAIDSGDDSSAASSRGIDVPGGDSTSNELQSHIISQEDDPVVVLSGVRSSLRNSHNDTACRGQNRDSTGKNHMINSSTITMIPFCSPSVSQLPVIAENAFGVDEDEEAGARHHQ